MQGFIVYPSYRIVDNKAYVYLFGRLENKETFLIIKEAKPYFYIKSSDNESLQHIEDEFTTVKTKLTTYLDEPLTKVVVQIPSQVPKIRDQLHKENVATYEADIRFVYRNMMDWGIKGAVTITGDYKKGQYVDRIYEDPQLEGSNFKPDLKTLSIDIETNMHGKEIYCVTLYAHDEHICYVVSNYEVENAIMCKDERTLLENVAAWIREYDPDIITGWSVIDFDLKVIKERCSVHQIPFILGRTEWESMIKINQSFFRDSQADIAGRMVLDGISLLKSNFIALSDYKLDTAAHEILGDAKLDVFDTTNKGKEIERLFAEDKKSLVEYNIKDAKLVLDILDKKNLIALTIQRSLLTGMQLDRVRASIASLDNLYVPLANKKGYACPTGSFQGRGQRISGGYVKESQPGIYDYVTVLDFKSLYPSIIRTFNIDPITHARASLEKKPIIAPNNAQFNRSAGILPELLETLWKSRDEAKKVNNNEASYAIKITMNSFFGVLANPNCRFYSLDMANAITAFGRFIVKTTADVVTKDNYEVIYGDTDSIFVNMDVTSLDDAHKNGIQIAKDINDYWLAYTKSMGVQNYLELQFEKTYVRFIMPTIRGSDKGAKKRYAGLRIIDGKEKIDFTGLEFVRRDWTDLSKEFQWTLLNKIFHKEEVTDYIKQFVQEVKNGKHDTLLIYKKAIRKDLDKYTKTTPPHVKAARKLDSITSSVISYVMTTDGPEPVQEIQHELDYDHYIEKQLKPIADSILGFYNTSFDELLSKTKQTSLFKF